MTVHIVYLSLAEFSSFFKFRKTGLPEKILLQAIVYPDKKKHQFLAARWLLLTLLQKYYGVNELPEFGLPKNGRPSFLDKAFPDFNISHSGDYIMLAVTGQGSVGVDIEVSRDRPKFLSLAEYSFSTQEADYLKGLPEKQIKSYFWRFWTIREAILKLKALSVWQMKKIILHAEKQCIQTDLMSSLYVRSFKETEFTWAVATQQFDYDLCVSKISFNSDSFTFDKKIPNAMQDWQQK